jgi:TonB family protein
MKRHLVASFLFLIAISALAASQIVPQHVRVSEDIVQGLMLKKVPPVYPPLARQARIQGTVLLKVTISKSGDVENLQLISGHPMLAPAAIEAVKQWKYKPYLLNGEPIEVETKVTVNFTLLDKPPAEGVAGDIPGGTQTGGTQTGGAQTNGAQNSEPASVYNGPVAQRIRVSAAVEQSLLISKVTPQYPADAREQHIQGTVLLSVTIDKEGNVANIQLISGHPALAPAAIEAVKEWKYRPYLLNGNPLVVETQVTVNFTLAD